jgi:RNA polymerase sigma-70 factor (ECF subfamily)
VDQPKELFLSLYFPVEQQLSNYCRALTGNDIEAVDLLQDTLLAGLESVNSLRKPEAFMFYMCAIAKRTYLKRFRRKKFEADINSIPPIAINEPNAGEVNADVQLLNQMISRLPIEQREALVMFEIIGFSLKEIQEFQGGSLSAIKSRIARAREKLAVMLTDQETEVYVKPSKNVTP